MSNNQDAIVLPPIDQQNMAMLLGVGTLLKGKQIHEYSIVEQRQIFREFQSPPEKNTDIVIQQLKVNTSHGEVETFVYKPKSSSDDLPFVYFIHGGGWTMGSACDWEEFLFDLVERTQLAVVFPEYTLAPERKYPTQQEQCVEILQHVIQNGGHYGLKADKLVVACDSVGGKKVDFNDSEDTRAYTLSAQLASAVSILNHKRSLGFPISHQIFLHPFLHTASTAKLIEMPLADPAWTEQSYTAYFDQATERSDILASPDLMTAEELKQYMPPTTIITSEIDGLRDQGENFAKALQKAGVRCGIVRAVGCLHDVEIFHLARDSASAELVMTMISAQLRQLFFGRNM